MIQSFKKIKKEPTLDPVSWDSLVPLGHKMLDDVMVFLKNIRKHKIEPISEEITAKSQQPVPLELQGYEETYIEWLKELLEYPQEASGVLVSGDSMANFTGLAVARRMGFAALYRSRKNEVTSDVTHAP
jgi:hypothetical protein